MHREAGLEDFLDRGALEALGRPLAEATTLPNIAYTSEAFLALENRRLFARTWVLAGFGQQIPQPGDVMPTTIAGMPVIVVRNREGAIGAFHNVCLHRGTTLVDKPRAGALFLTCPYHAWSYDLEGYVRGRPNYHGADRHDAIKDQAGAPRLTPIRVGLWHDWIFVDIDGEAPPLDEHLRPLIDSLDGYEVGGLRYGGAEDFTIRANWKLVHENFIDIYHKPAVHPRLEQAAPVRNNYPTTWEGACFIMSHKMEAAHEGRGIGLPHLDNLSEKRRTEGLFYHLFPTLDVGFWPDQMVVIDVRPVAADLCHETIHYFFAEAAMAARYESLRAKVKDTWRELNNEDIGIVQRMQIGRHSSAFSGGMTVPAWDGPIQRFCQLVVETMNGRARA
jgi:choline monooxygenase